MRICLRRLTYFKVDGTNSKLYVMVSYNGRMFCYGFHPDIERWIGGTSYEASYVERTFAGKEFGWIKVAKPEDVPHCPFGKGEKT